MGWDVRLRPRDGAAAPHPAALTHARFLLGRHPGAAVEVRDAASGEAVVYRLTGGAMVRLGAASA